MDNSKERTLQNYLIAGGFGGICTTLIGHPFDTIKVRMQVVPGLYINSFDATWKIITHEGRTGLYKGMSAQLIGIVPIFALSILSYESGKKLLTKIDEDEQNLKPKKLFLAGMFSGLTTTIFSVPGERIKCLLQMQVC
ncbi:mitochondrial carnitine/acylcarnitine carrier protein-like [Aphidius gifuensis]|uniref:mitochondrial carnitine/acylcarnitine carrier protein-like n=1 Tax=Aphidius gifuensis TaxID=684658 RepID=UPI001CDD1DBA|nr:mitochondrial carnitine/acylcarnitine carrier protein-like [Aphidius gifuensis]